MCHLVSILQAATKKMIQEGIKGKVVFVGSTLSYMSFVGYATYSPAKHALRGSSSVEVLYEHASLVLPIE